MRHWLQKRACNAAGYCYGKALSYGMDGHNRTEMLFFQLYIIFSDIKYRLARK